MFKLRKSLKNLFRRTRLVSAAVLLLGVQALAPVSAFIPEASAATVCINDVQGSNDEPGQKDLSRMCVDDAGLPTSVYVEWRWDAASLSGGNTGDACALFDTDGDGNANFAACVTIESVSNGAPATQKAGSPRIFTCNDTRIDRCAGDSLVPGPYTSTCSVAQQPETFGNGEGATDTAALCTIQMSEVGGASVAELLDVCSVPSQQPNADPSDCIRLAPNKGKLEVQKSLNPADDPGLFNLVINGDGTANDFTAPNQTNGGTTGERIVSAGTYTVSETAGTSTSLANYTSSIECRDLNGTGDVVASNPNGTSVSVQVDASNSAIDDIVCVITNTRKTGTITLIKSVTNDNGGTAGVNDFGLSIGGTSVTSGQTLTLNPGSYAINEAGLAGYNFVSLTGTGCPTQLGGNVVLANDQDITCTITNDDQAGKLIVKKVVVNDNGGTKEADDFTFSVDGGAAVAFEADGQNDLTVNAGTYDVTEPSVTGYATTYDNCEDVVVSLGETETCTITNDDVQPKLTVTKVVVNDNGGDALVSDFPLFVDATGVTSGVQNGFNANSYVVSETPLQGYAGTITGDCDAQGNITLSVGDVKSCTITNDDVAPILTVIKTVVNDNGGLLDVANFNLYVDGNSVTSGVPNVLNAGAHVVSEDNQPGYTAGSWGGDCDTLGNVVLAVGGQYTCTITNDDQAGTLIVKKVVVNDNGGTKEADDFGFSVNGGGVVPFEADGQNDLTVNAGTYDVTEPTVTGYATTYDNCDDVVVSNGETETCTITNNDVQPKLTVTKVVTNDNGGNAVVADFPLFVDATGVTSGVQNGFNADDYVVSETGMTGYTATISGDCDAQGNVTLEVGDVKACTITNDDVAPTVTLIKSVTNDNGGTAGADDFGLTVGGNATNSGDVNNVMANTPVALDEAGLFGYEFVSITGDDKCPEVLGGTVTLDEGENVTCTITNDDIGPKLKIVKKAYPEGAQDFLFTSASLGDFTLDDDDDATLENNKQFEDLQAGEHSVTEQTVENWELKDIYCVNNQGYDGLSGNTLTVELEVGDDVTCYFVNVEKNTVSGHKFNDINGNHVWDENEPSLANWTINITSECEPAEEVILFLDNIWREEQPEECVPVNESTVTDANGAYSFNELEPGTYTVCEVQQAKWTQTFPETEDGCHVVEIEGPGQTVTADFGNKAKPQVLGELVKTGDSANNSVVAGLLILSALVGLHFITRRRKTISE